MSNTLERADIYKLLEQINDYGNTISDRTCSLPLEHASIKPKGQP